MAWDVMSGVTKTAWDVLSGVANLCGMFCAGVKKWHGMFCPGMFCPAPEKARLCISDNRPHKEHQRLSVQHHKDLILKQNLKTLIQKGVKFMKN